MNFEQYVKRVNFHLDNREVQSRPSQQAYVDAWNNQVAAKKMATAYARRVRGVAGPTAGIEPENATRVVREHRSPVRGEN